MALNFYKIALVILLLSGTSSFAEGFAEPSSPDSPRQTEFSPAPLDTEPAYSVELDCVGLNAQVVGSAAGYICNDRQTSRKYLVSLLGVGAALHFSADIGTAIKCKVGPSGQVTGNYHGVTVAFGAVLDIHAGLNNFISNNGSECLLDAQSILTGFGIGADLYSRVVLSISPALNRGHDD